MSCDQRLFHIFSLVHRILYAKIIENLQIDVNRLHFLVFKKQLSRYASLTHNIYIAADPTTVDFDHAAHACHHIVRPQCLITHLNSKLVSHPNT